MSGNNILSPMKSVRNPGVMRVKPPNKTNRPSNSSWAGRRPSLSAWLIPLITIKPWVLARYAPITAVKKIISIVLKAPIILPILIRRYSSAMGIIVNNMNNLKNILIEIS